MMRAAVFIQDWITGKCLAHDPVPFAFAIPMPPFSSNLCTSLNTSLNTDLNTQVVRSGTAFRNRVQVAPNMATYCLLAAFGQPAGSRNSLGLEPGVSSRGDMHCVVDFWGLGRYVQNDTFDVINTANLVLDHKPINTNRS